VVAANWGMYTLWLLPTLKKQQQKNILALANFISPREEAGQTRVYGFLPLMGLR